jgi:hypothetical protein
VIVLQIVLNLSPYMINYLNSFSDVKASRATEFIVRQYMYACRGAEPIEESTVTYVKKQRVKPTHVMSQKVSQSQERQGAAK